MDFEDELEEKALYSNAQEYAECYPQEKFLVTYIKSYNKYNHIRVQEYCSNAAIAGKLVEALQSQDIDTVQVFKLEPYSIAKVLAVHEKKRRRANRRAAKRE